MATAGQPPLFPASDAPTLTEEQQREELFRKQVELGTPADQARAYADRVVLRTGAPRKKAAAAKRVKKASGGTEAAVKASDALVGPARSLESQVVDADSGSVVSVEEGGNKRGLLPVHHPNRDFFLCDLFDYALKDDGDRRAHV